MGAVNKKYLIEASSDVVFQALTKESAIVEWSGNRATMNLKKGGTFSLWGGTIHGENLKISKEQITQNWKEENWEQFSKVTFNIVSKGESTEIELIHEDIPVTSLKSINTGWDDHYMMPLKAFAEDKKNK